MGATRLMNGPPDLRIGPAGELPFPAGPAVGGAAHGRRRRHPGARHAGGARRGRARRARRFGCLAAAGASASPATTTCALGANGSSVKHVIYIQFDNVHYTRDNPNVPSDLEQMPNLLNFITGNGTLISHEHTPLIAHTADDIVTSETGLYGSDQGIPIANEYNYYTPSGSTDTAGSFAYWTDPVVDYDTTTSAPVGDSDYTLVTAQGKNAPAPWVPYTRAGCDFGSVAAADTELENTLPDIPLVFGANSPEAKEAENPKLANKAEADFMGLSVHCAQGRRSALPRTAGWPTCCPTSRAGTAGTRRCSATSSSSR